MSSWKDAYKLRAGIVGANIDRNIDDDTEFRSQISASELAQANFRKQVKSTAPLKQPDAKTEAQLVSDSLDETIKKGGIEGFGASVAKVAETPVIKEILNVLSTGAYATANTADNLLDAGRNLKDGNLRGITDAVMAAPTGIAQGLNAGIAQNKEDATLWGDVIKHGQEDLGLDTENDAAKWTQGVGGFIGDVALDPTTYLTLGTTAVAKGAVRGAVQGGKKAKTIAEETIRKAEDASEISPIKGGMTYGEIAANPKGRLGTAFSEASKSHGDWRIARAKRKAEKKAVKNAETGTRESEWVGSPKVDEFQAEIDARNSELVAAQKGELEAQLEAEMASFEPPTAQSLINEIEPAPKIEEPKVEEPSLPETFAEEVKATVDQAPIAPPVVTKPKIDGKTLTELESVFQRPKYGRANIAKELSQPGEATIKRMIPDPEGGTIRVPKAERGANSTTKFTGRTAESKDIEKARKATAGSKTKARLKDEKIDWDNAPQLSDPKYGIIVDEAGKPTHLTTENFDEYVDPDKWATHVEANGDEMVSIRKNGIESKMKLKQLATMIESGSSPKIANEYIRQNLDKFVQHLDDYDDFKDDIDGFVGQWKAEHDAYTAPAKQVDEADNTLDDIVNDDTELIAKMIEVEEANPNAWSPERAQALGIDPNDAVLTPAEISALKLPMTNAQITAKIKKGDLPKSVMDMLRALTGKSSPEEIGKEFIALRAEYKKELKEAVKPQKAVRDSKEKEVARFLDGQESVKPIKATDEHIDEVKAEATDLAEEFTKSPVAFDEAYQMEFRRMAFRDAVLDKNHGIPDKDLLEIKNVDTGAVGKKAIAEFAHDAVKDALAVQLKEAPHRTGNKYRTLTEDKTTGGAWSPKIWGSASQQALHDSIIHSMTKQSFKYPALQRKFYMSALKIADAELRAAGVEPFLNQVDNIAGKAKTNVSLYDMFASLDEAGQVNILDRYVFGLRSESFNITQLQGAVESLLRMRKAGLSESAIRTRMKSQLISSQRNHGRPINHDKAALDNTTARLNTIADKNKALEEVPDKMLSRAVKRIDGANASKIVDSLMDPTVYRSLTYRSLINTAAHNSSLGDFVEKYSENMVERLYQLSDTEGVGSAMKYFTEELRRLKTEMSPADYEFGRDALNVKLAEAVSEAERTVIETSVKREKIAETKPLPVAHPKAEATETKVQNEVNKTHVTEAKAVEKETADTPKPDDTEFFEIKAAEIANAAAKKMHPLQKFVNPQLGLSTDVYRAVNSGLHSIARQQAHFHQSLSMHLEKYSADSLRSDFEELQIMARNHNEKNPFTFPEGTSESVRELYGIMGTMFEVSNKNVFARNAIGTKHFNALAKANGLPETWRFKEGLSVYDNSHLWANEWEGIGEKGVLDFLSKMHSVAVKSSQEIAIGASFSKEFGKLKPEPGHVKLVWNNRRGSAKESSFYDLIDHDLYYPKDIASQVIQVNNLMRESRSLSTKTPVGKFFVNVFDPVTNALKASQTTVRPGHWVVSFGGDLLRNQIAGVNSVVPYRHSVRIMKAGGLNPDDFIGKIDSAEALAKYRKSQEVSSGFMSNAEGNGMHFMIGNKKSPVSYETLEKMLHDVVMLPKHRGGGGVVEDRFVGENVTNKLSRRLEKATDFVTDNQKFSLNHWAAQRDNFMRIALAVDFASKRKWNSLTEMKKGMEDYVVKWAPTSTDMTAFESKYVRRSMLYYTWLRGITPRIIDAAMTKPGVATIVPKALYNVAYANGLNPESIGNPFPEDDTLFPSYYYNQVLGPQWKDDFGMWGINPSSPVIEVANTFKNFTPGDPAGNVMGAGKMALGMSTPFAKMPIEMSMGQQASGIPIEDNLQYMEDNLGGSYAGAISRATGKTLNMDGIVDRTDSAAKGTPEEQAEQAKLQIINFLSGMKLTDFKSDSAVKAALYDVQDKNRQEIDAQRRGQ